MKDLWQLKGYNFSLAFFAFILALSLMLLTFDLVHIGKTYLTIISRFTFYALHCIKILETLNKAFLQLNSLHKFFFYCCSFIPKMGDKFIAKEIKEYK